LKSNIFLQKERRRKKQKNENKKEKKKNKRKISQNFLTIETIFHFLIIIVGFVSWFVF